MRVLLDTNILLRAFASPDGPAGEVLELLRSPHVHIISLSMLDELEDVLYRERIRQLHHRNDVEISEFLQRLQSAALVLEIPADSVPLVVPDDPDDDVVIATAISGNAEVICTLDRHFRKQDVVDYCNGKGIQILTDVELLNLLRQD